LDESERSQSNAGKADEIRARRAAEERERRMREKEREDAQRRKVGSSPQAVTHTRYFISLYLIVFPPPLDHAKAEIAELVRARKEQALDKIERQERMKYLQEEEYKNALMYTKTMAEREEKEDHDKRAKVRLV